MGKSGKRRPRPASPIARAMAVVAASPAQPLVPRWQQAACALLPGLLVLVLFWPVLSFDFVNLDDNSNLKKNPAMQAVGLAWEKPYLDAYLPMVYTVWAGLHAVSRQPVAESHSLEDWSPIPELDPAPFHAANLALHLANSLLLYCLVITLFPACSPLVAALLAALFAVHPLQVEPVSWVTALKDVLSGTFSLAAILCFARRSPANWRGRDTALLCACFLLACLSKSTRVFLPLWLAWLGTVHWRQSWTQAALRLWPLFAVAVLVTLLAMVVQPAPRDMAFQEVWRRPLVALDALGFYVAKCLWPSGLALDYGRNPRFLFESGQVYLTAAASAALLAALLRWRGRLDPWLLLGLGGLVLSLLPLLGFKPFMFQTISTVSDRYAYLSLALLLACLPPLLGRLPPRAVVATLAGLVLAASLQARTQLPAWQDSAHLWRHTLSVTPDSGIAHNNLASIHEALGQMTEAIHHYEQSTIRLPLAQTYARIAILYSDQQDWARAREWNEKGLALEPGNSLMLNNRAFFDAQLQRRGFRLSH